VAFLRIHAHACLDSCQIEQVIDQVGHLVHAPVDAACVVSPLSGQRTGIQEQVAMVRIDCSGERRS